MAMCFPIERALSLFMSMSTFSTDPQDNVEQVQNGTTTPNLELVVNGMTQDSAESDAASTVPTTHAFVDVPAEPVSDSPQEQPADLDATGRPRVVFPVPPPVTEHGPARIIALCNQKGGVGKTTTTINLGAAIAETGRRVLLVDFDPQGALSVGLGVNPHELDLTIYNLLMQREVRVDDVLLKTAVPGLDLLPGNIDLSAAEVQLVSEVAREQTLARVLAPVLGEYDVILIDCQPSLGLLTVNALAAADGVIIPLECEFFALRGVALLMDTIYRVQERINPRLEVEGILATMYDSRTLHGREVLSRVVEAFDDKVFHTVIARTVRFPETTVAGEPITTYASSSTGAAAYRELAREVLAK
jgi:chromosome partitioning protein